MTAPTGFQLAAFMPYVIALLTVVGLALMFLSVRYAREVKANGGRGGVTATPAETAASEQPSARTLPQSVRPVIN